MASSLINRIGYALQRFEILIENIISRRFPPALCIVELTNYPTRDQSTPPSNPFSLENLIGDGLFWAVPKSRRTVEKRLKRKFGDPKYHWKPLKLKTNLLVCNSCGNHYEAGILCVYCYTKVKLETQEMQDAIQASLDLSPVDKDVVVVYDGENSEKMKEYWKNKRIVELPKKRPSWFQNNLLQQTTQEPADSKEVEPTQLG
ncbi:39S ribosomal protein L32, mitochondrial isoform X2 [Athalia rosae]|uniref:39S ribosomal protein L32, mitochondrial isoform X2 n=1 Tax=Athalia rosae TaxID=37344 RepID=UPI000626DD5C|nr:39S ribosomal protein L32, mitochondrial isoform X2 [Athalia rosae]